MFTRSVGFAGPKIYSVILVCFGAATLFAAPQLRLSTAAVGPVYVELGGIGPAQTIDAFNIGDGSLNLSISSSASWLTGAVGAPTNCTGGPVPACIPIQITLSTASLAVGTYTETITVSATDAIDSPQNVTVTVQVDGAPSGFEWYVTPAGGPLPSASVFVNTSAPAQASIKTSDGGNWLSFTPAGEGNYTVFTPYILKATALPGQLGDYTGTVTLSGSSFAADDQTIKVTLRVTSQPILDTSAISFRGTSAVVSFKNIGLGNLFISNASVSLGLPCQGSFYCYLVAKVVSQASISLFPACGSYVPGGPCVANVLPGVFDGNLTLNSNAANTAVPIRVHGDYPWFFTPPTLYFGGVVDNAAFSNGTPVASGSIASVFGSEIARSEPAYATGVPLPTKLGGVQILVNGAAAPLFYVDSNQVVFQVPFGMTSGTTHVQAVVDGAPAGNTISAQVDPIAPRLFPLKSLPPAPDLTPYGNVINASDGTLAIPSNLGVPAHPAHRGDVLTIYALGLGPVSPSVATGSAAPASEPLAQISNSIQVLFGGSVSTALATPSCAGLAPNFVGLYQVNVTIPLDAPAGNVPVILNLTGNASNIVEMAIDPNPR